MRKLVLGFVGLVAILWGVSSATASTAATFTSSPSAGPPGASIAVVSVTSCPANPAGVTGPRVVTVSLARGSTVFSSIEVSPSSSGAWRGTLVVPRSATPGTATLSAFCLSSRTAEGATLAYDPRIFTVTTRAVAPAPPAHAVTVVPRVTG